MPKLNEAIEILNSLHGRLETKLVEIKEADREHRLLGVKNLLEEELRFCQAKKEEVQALRIASVKTNDKGQLKRPYRSKYGSLDRLQIEVQGLYNTMLEYDESIKRQEASAQEREAQVIREQELARHSQQMGAEPEQPVEMASDPITSQIPHAARDESNEHVINTVPTPPRHVAAEPPPTLKTRLNSNLTLVENERPPTPPKEERIYKNALEQLKALKLQPHPSEIDKPLDNLLVEIENLKGKEPISELIEVLQKTYLRLTNQLGHKDYIAIAKTMQGAPSNQMKYLGILMTTLGIIVATLGVVFAPAMIGFVAAASITSAVATGFTAAAVSVTSLGLLAPGITFFSKSFQQKGLCKAMSELEKTGNAIGGMGFSAIN